ncbi:TIGR04282 family arsenosugar biosynthesis glycosyltransferase [Nocardioides sp.]|uniref:TIGR04282 family arsenosugar biosynthesis glycosyltransferase n=1 Tax=Nocardioides sp. TaxID=35761 RepID=UPI002B53CD38|nr:DUF2064 domain-containing protein [Nocardioides sp.]HXH78439.1 DUF2064 domain-containing protein [Nocardioides sp.]
MTVLVMAKAPVPGLVKTRLAVDLGDQAAAELAAAALLDTIEATRASGATGLLALAGDLTDAVGGDQIAAALTGWRVMPQRGRGFAERLVAAHADAGEGVVVQVGMDTPQLTGSILRDAAAALVECDAVLGPALDGGWWVLARRDPRVVEALAGVAMSTPTTGEATAAALARAGHRVSRTALLRDVDTLDDARAVAALAPDTRFARAWRSTPAATR